MTDYVSRETRPTENVGAILLSMEAAERILSGNQDMRWYVVHNGSGHDDKAARILRENQFETYIPMKAEMKVMPQRKLSARQRRSLIPVVRRELRPLFPRYFFVRFDLRQEGWTSVFDRAGLRGVLAVPNSVRRLPAEIDGRIISALRNKEMNGAIPEDVPIERIYEIGERVRIKGGPFSGHNAKVEECPPGQLSGLDEAASVKLLVALLGRETVVEMSIFDIAKL